MMRTLQTAGLMLVLMGLMGMPAQAATVSLHESALNVDGSLFAPSPPGPGGPCTLPGCPGGLPGSVVGGSVVDTRDAMGLGTFALSVTGAAAHYVAFYADFEIDLAP